MGLRIAWGAAVVLAVTAMAPARAGADELTEVPAIEPEVKLSHRIRANISELSNELGKHLSALSFDMVGLQFDALENRARVEIDAGDEDLSLRFDSDVHFRGGAARVKARIDLGLAGRRLSFDLPEFDMVPRSENGRRYVELRLPLIEGSF